MGASTTLSTDPRSLNWINSKNKAQTSNYKNKKEKTMGTNICMFTLIA